MKKFLAALVLALFAGAAFAPAVAGPIAHSATTVNNNISISNNGTTTTSTHTINLGTADWIAISVHGSLTQSGTIYAPSLPANGAVVTVVCNGTTIYSRGFGFAEPINVFVVYSFAANNYTCTVKMTGNGIGSGTGLILNNYSTLFMGLL